MRVGKETPRASEEDVSLTNVTGYSQGEATWLARGERQLFDRLLEPGMDVLDLGCGTGRITRELVHRDLRIWACDLNPVALESVRCSLGSSPNLVVQLADARELPFEDQAFDAVIFAFNGLDFIHPERDRFRATAEVSRVLRPRGVFIFSSHNPLAKIFSPRGARSRCMLRWRFFYLLARDFRSTYFRDISGLLLYHALPRRVISDIEKATPLTFELAINRSGTTSLLPLLTLLSSWPYYVFRKTATDACHAQPFRAS